MEEARAKANSPDAQSNPLMPIPSPDKILEALGIGGFRSLAFFSEQSPGGELGGMFLGVPEQARTGLLKLMLAEPKDSSPPPFVPADAANFSRWRLDAKKAWNGFESLLNSLSPQFGVTLNFILANVGKDKDPNFDVKQSLFGNLGDDLISYAKPPRSSALDDIAQPPSLGLMASPNPAELANALQMLASLSPLGGGAMKEREFLGRTIYSLGLPSQPAADGTFKEMAIHFAATGDYVALTLDAPMLEEYLRGTAPDQPLRGKSGLAEAAEKVGGLGSGFFAYDNPRATLRMIFDMLRKNPDTFEEIISAQFTGMPGIELWNAEKRKEWLDFSLLPPFEQVEKYFGFTVFGVKNAPEGIEFKGFTPTPPAIR